MTTIALASAVTPHTVSTQTQRLNISRSAVCVTDVKASEGRQFSEEPRQLKIHAPSHSGLRGPVASHDLEVGRDIPTVVPDEPRAGPSAAATVFSISADEPRNKAFSWDHRAAPTPVSAPASYQASPASSPPFGSRGGESVPSFELGDSFGVLIDARQGGGGGGGGSSVGETMSGARERKSRKGKAQPHRRSSSFSSKSTRSPQLQSLTSHAAASTITGETKFTKPAQGALRMNKFVQRLHTTLMQEAGRDTVTWEKGCLKLHSVDDFTRDILPAYFKTSNFKTFRRQLNYYGFVHAKSVQDARGRTTAFWMNQELASTGCSDVDSILLLKRVDASEGAKTVDGRRMRKEGAINILAKTDASVISPTDLRKSTSSRSSSRTKPRPRVVSRESIENIGASRGGSRNTSRNSSRNSSPVLKPVESIESSKLYNKIVNANSVREGLYNNSSNFNSNHNYNNSVAEISAVARQLMGLRELGGRGRISPRAGGEGFSFMRN
ncbi:hypothetical protein TrVE_jg9110 [Triparma verrucosa]|uniref:HSF-type DNA-binding domain-containing protein n=1 Tax=Triparma verrucosa TaxID=1606542 RepID=A0A9W7EQS3_9STRA|nr:hypothetical protein TrVE_jg9110 [Triparma verrucosa]